MTSAGMEGTLAPDESPLELTINNPAYFLADTEPMGVVAEVIRNDMGDALGIMVYDDATRQVHKFRAGQLVTRPDGSVTVLPSWFKKSRDIIRSIEPMEQAVPAIRQAGRKGVGMSAEDAARATAAAGPQVQRYIDEAVILRSQLIGKLHGLFEKQATSDEQLRQLVSPGLFARGSDADRQVQIATLKRSNRLNAQTIHAMRDFLARMDASYLFPKDHRYRTLFRVEEAPAPPPAAPAPAGEAEEFEAFEEAEEFETFEEEVPSFDVAEPFEDVDEFEDVPEAVTFEDAPPPPPPPPSASPYFDDVEALPDSDDITVSQPSLMAVGAPGWAPPQVGTRVPAPPVGAPLAAPPSPPGATAAVPPAPMPSMEEFEASGQRKLDGRAAEPEHVAKKASLLGRLRRGKEKRERPPVAPARQAFPEEFAPVDEFETFQEEEEFETFEEEPEAPPATHRPFVMSTPPTRLPPPPAYVPHAPAPVETFQEVPATEEFAPVAPASPPPPPPAATPAPRPAAAAPMVPVAPPPAPAAAVDEFETFEEEMATFEEETAPAPAPAPAPEPEPRPGERPLDAEKDIDAILAMALGKAPPPKSRPTAKPGVRETSTPMQNILAKSKYRRND